MMTPLEVREAASLMEKWADNPDLQIEYTSRHGSETWHPIGHPGWNWFDFRYREAEAFDT